MRPTTPHRLSPVLLCGLALSSATVPAHARQQPPDPPPVLTPAPDPSPRPSPEPVVDPTADDRAALIAEDMAQHPPQAQTISRDASHLQIAHARLGGLLDRSVRGTGNSEVGRVIDVLTSDDGKPAALELDVGGFMGVGNRKIAVAWGLFDLTRTGSNDPLRVALSEAQVRSAPAADSNGEIAMVTGLVGAPAKPRDATSPVDRPVSVTPPAVTPSQPVKAPPASPATPPVAQGRP
jgi:hypothetical protein